MELTHRMHEAGVLVVAFKNDNLDASNVREFRDAMHSLIKDQQRVVLDMSGLKFVDSSGLGALISCLREMNSRRGDFRLCSMSKSITALFELMRMHRVFGIHDSIDGAARAFG